MTEYHALVLSLDVQERQVPGKRRLRFDARHRPTFLAALVVAVVYALSLWGMPKHVFWMPDEGAKLFELESCGLSWRDGVTYRIPFAGQSLVPGYEFLPGFDVYPTPSVAADGSLYLAFDTPVVFPLLSAPFYRVFGAPGLYALPVLSGWLTALLAGVLASWFAAGLAAPAVLLVGLATPVWFYSVVFWEHTLATLFGLFGVCLVVRAPRRLESLVFAAPAILVATMLRSEMALLGAALAAAWAMALVGGWLRPPVPGETMPPARDSTLARRSGGWRVLALAAGSIVVLAVVLQATLTTRHRGLLRLLPERLDQALSGIANLPHGMLEVYVNSESLGPTMGGLWLAATALAIAMALVAPWLRSERRQARTTVAALTMMLLCSLSLAFAPEPYRGLHGFFPVAPFLILWPYGLRHAWRRGDSRLLALATCSWVYLLSILGALAVTYMHQGVLDVGMEWGQRYLLTAYPMMTVLALVGLRALRAVPSPAWPRKSIVALFTSLVLTAGCLELRGIRMLYGTRGMMAKWDAAMRAEDGPVVTVVWWIVPAVAELFLTHEMFFTWLSGLADWVEQARTRGVTEFTLAHTEPLSDEEIGAPRIRRVAATRQVVGGLLLTRFEID